MNQDFLATEGFDFRNMKFHLGKIPFHPCKDYDFCCGQNMSLFLKKNYNLTGIQYFPLKKDTFLITFWGENPHGRGFLSIPTKYSSFLPRRPFFSFVSSILTSIDFILQTRFRRNKAAFSCIRRLYTDNKMNYMATLFWKKISIYFCGTTLFTFIWKSLSLVFLYENIPLLL